MVTGLVGELPLGANARPVVPAALDATPLRRLIHSGNSYEEIDSPTQERRVAEQRGDKIESRRAYESPVQAAHYEEHGGHYVYLLHLVISG